MEVDESGPSGGTRGSRGSGQKPPGWSSQSG